MTRILYLVEGPAPYGANRSLLSLIEYGLSHGIQPMVVGSRHGPFSEWLQARGVSFKAIGHRFSIYPRTNTFVRKVFFAPIFTAFRIINAIALLRLVLICRSFRPDVIHTNIGPIAIGYLAARLMGIRHVWHLREYQDLDFGMKFFPSKSAFERLLARSARVICVTQAIAEHFGLPTNATVISNGVASGNAAVLTMPKADYFLFVGRLEPAKQTAQVIEAYLNYVKTASNPLRLLIAGDGDLAYIADLKSIAASAPSTARIEFLGFRDDTDSLMRNARAIIVASDNEGFGRITAEAMFNGCLVIGKATGGTADILDAHQAEPLGLLFSTSSELASQLDFAAEMSPEMYETKVRHAQRKAIARYSTELYGAKVLEVYAGLGSQGGSDTQDGLIK